MVAFVQVPPERTARLFQKAAGRCEAPTCDEAERCGRPLLSSEPSSWRALSLGSGRPEDVLLICRDCACRWFQAGTPLAG